MQVCGTNRKMATSHHPSFLRVFYNQRKGLDGLPVPRRRPALAWLLNKDEVGNNKLKIVNPSRGQVWFIPYNVCYLTAVLYQRPILILRTAT